MRKILCNGRDARGNRCGRWLARVENGRLYIYCPRCRGYHEEPLANFLDDLIALANALKESGVVDVDEREERIIISGGRRVFG